MKLINTNYRNHFGLSLIELMVAITIGSLLMLGLTTTFKNSSDTQRELEKSGRLVENGRYAIDIVTSNIHHTGFYGQYFEALATPAALPDPCEVATANTTLLKAALAMPIQGYTAASLTARPVITATSCDDQGLLPTTAPFNNTVGSDIFVVRRASTDVFTGTIAAADADRVYIQSNAREAQLLLGVSGTTINDTTTVDAATTPLEKYVHDDADEQDAETYEYNVHVYFVAPCSFGTGTSPDGTCTASDDAIPTLKRLELSTNGTATQMDIVPLVEGVEYMKVSYGIDTSPATINLTTGFAGDGIPDSYVTTPTLAQWQLVVSVRLHFLIRATEATTGFSDAKQYNFSSLGLSLGPFNDTFKRHVYLTEIRPMNLSGRREQP